MKTKKTKKAKKVKKVRSTISGKIMRSIILVNLLVVALIGGVVYLLLSSQVADEFENIAKIEVNSEINKIDQSFKQVESVVKSISAEIATDVDVAKGKKDIKYLRDYTDSLEEKFRALGMKTDITSSVYMYFNVEMFGDAADVWLLGRGEYVRQPMIVKSYYDDPHEWYDVPVKQGITRWTAPYAGTTGDNIGNLVTSYVTPIEKDGEIIGMVGMDLDLREVQDSLNQIQLFDSGYLYMMSPEGDIYVHQRLPWLDTDGDGNLDTPQKITDRGDFQFLLDDMAANQEGITKYRRDDGVHVISAFGHLSNGWIVASSIPRNEVLAIVTNVLLLIGGIAILSIIAAIVISVLMGRSITKPINDIVKVIEKIKDGDLTDQVEVKSNDETKLLADGLNAMIESVSELIKEAKHVSSDMVDNAQLLAAMSEQTNATVDQVATAVEEIGKGTQDTASDAESGAKIAGEIDGQFSVLMDNSSSMAENANSAFEMNKTGRVALDTLKEKSDEANSSNSRVKDAIYNLDQKASTITDIIATITSIAEQTNLLALNASIEAARAGDAGKGFAVVAEEIRKLAESSSEAADEISNIIRDIQHESKETVNVMEVVDEMNQQQNVAFNDVSQSFDKIFASMESISDQINVVTKELDELDTSKNNLVTAVTNISAVSEQTAAATEEVGMSMNEQTRAIEEVAKSANTLNQLSTELNSKISVFKV